MREFTFERERKDWRKLPGPWDSEPDKRVWTDDTTGLPCLIVRNPYMGHLCGYVGVPRGHPWFSKQYGCVDADAHGGLTYADIREDENTWWLGFDCGHAFDTVPYRPWDMPSDPPTDYRDIDYVTNQCEQLAVQAHNANIPREVTT